MSVHTYTFCQIGVPWENKIQDICFHMLNLYFILITDLGPGRCIAKFEWQNKFERCYVLQFCRKGNFAKMSECLQTIGHYSLNETCFARHKLWISNELEEYF